MADFSESGGSSTGDGTTTKGSGSWATGCNTVLGVLLIVGGLGALYYAQSQIRDAGSVFQGIAMSQPEAATGMEGRLVKIQGQPEGEFLTHKTWDGQALYCHQLAEICVETVDDEGSIRREWNTVAEDRQWVEQFSLEGIQVRPADAHPVGREQVHFLYRRHTPRGYQAVTDPGGRQVGDQRDSVEVLDASGPVIVAGEMVSGAIAGGQIFIVSTLGDAETLETLRGKYRSEKRRWLIGALVAILCGLLTLLYPWLRSRRRRSDDGLPPCRDSG